ncbi:armadillo repeat-containing protein 8-like isoform X1 [Lytechinus pictus]|uniref:armadillo repeat-containing protein 8-like isoform X1 n=1 Tax=Lytechinus pictus TaxID=7653 RepID=UPI00240E6A1E|nr:armadillo repeat-containing protein 8-like [Lytechinus pictus]
MDHGFSQVYVDNLMVTDQQQLLLNLKLMKNVIIGSNKQKTNLMLCGAVDRIHYIMTSEGVSPEILVESAVLLGSFAKGTVDNKRELMDRRILAVMLQGLGSDNIEFVEACLRFLRTILTSSIAPVDDLVFEDASVIPRLIHLLPKTLCSQECVAHILSQCCKTTKQQDTLYQQGAVDALAPLLCSEINKIRLPALQCLAALSYQNRFVSFEISTAKYNREDMSTLLSRLLARDLPVNIQLTAAKCLCYLCRAGAISSRCPLIVQRVLPSLARMCKKDRSVEERVEAAETLAFLIEEDVSLQVSASITDHLIPTIALFLKYSPSHSSNKEHGIHTQAELRQAAFKVFASLGANVEEIRKKIIETDNLMDTMEKSIEEENLKVQLASARCLHSLSRSVQQLRTSFQDHIVWKPLVDLLQHESADELMIVASSTLCNLLLEFSPSKDKIVQAGAIDILCKLTTNSNASLRLNGIWGLMNMAFQADENIKTNILEKMGTDQLFRLLIDTNVDILMKTLGLLRNLLSTRLHIDNIMLTHSSQIMTAVIMILEGNHPPQVKEQTLCILANIADGTSAKEVIMSNEDILKKLTCYMRHDNVRLQIASVYCINNLVWNQEDGATERQSKLKEYGIQKQLQSLLNASDTVLFDKVKMALQQFSS